MRVGVGRQLLLFRAGLQVDEQAFGVLVPVLADAPARVAAFEGEEPFIVEVGAPEQRLLVGVRQEGLEGFARQEDQPEPLVA